MGVRVKKTIHIDKFDNTLNSNAKVRCQSFYNYAPSKKLNNSYGIRRAKFPALRTDLHEVEIDTSTGKFEKLKGVSYIKQYFPQAKYTQHRLLVYGDDKKVYINQLFSYDLALHYIYDLKFDTPPVTLEYKKDDEDVVILTSSNKMYVWKVNYSPYLIQDVPIITSMCMNEGVLYCTVADPAFKIWFNNNLDAEHIGNIDSNSGYITLADELGYSRKILTFKEDVYVFRDYGISRITNNKGNISVTQVYLSNTKIFPNTISVCGNVIMFMTAEGIYIFNGVKVSKMPVELKNHKIHADESALASSLKEKYYLALRIEFDDGRQILCEQSDYVNNALIIIDTLDYSYQILRGVDIGGLLPVKIDLCEKMLVTFNTGDCDKLGEITSESKAFNEPLPKCWRTDELCDNMNTKLFTKFIIKAKSGVKIKLINDERETTFTTYADGINEFCFRICATQLRIELSSDLTDAQVDNAEIEYYEY